MELIKAIKRALKGQTRRSVNREELAHEIYSLIMLHLEDDGDPDNVLRCGKPIPARYGREGDLKTPVRVCDYLLDDVREDGFGSCPYHGLVSA